MRGPQACTLSRAAKEANHPQLTTAKEFYVDISRARDRAELVTDDAQTLICELARGGSFDEIPFGLGEANGVRTARGAPNFI